MSKNISILGVTGSIGSSTIQICNHFPDDVHITGVSTNRNIAQLKAIINKCRPMYAVVTDINAMQEYFGSMNGDIDGIPVYCGSEGIDKICSDHDADIIINGISGIAGLQPSLKILNNGIDLALANKESMVCAGDLLKAAAESYGSTIIPVDSEHSALFHLLHDRHPDSIDKLYLTASGGPFLNMPKNRWDSITKEDALKHPTWTMGSKITIDSATMANKGLEVIEAHYFFELDYDRIKVLVHPQSLIHSMIETIDGELYAQIGPTDMSIPIQNAIFYPDMKENHYNRIDFSNPISLELHPVDLEQFRMLHFAYVCGEKRGLYPAFYNIINEELVAAFLLDRISFIQIEQLCEEALELFEKETDIEKRDVTDNSLDSLIKYCKMVVTEIIPH